jgi:hypothetical protein
MVKYFHISSYIRKPFLKYDFATDPITSSLYMKKISFLFHQCLVGGICYNNYLGGGGGCMEETIFLLNPTIVHDPKPPNVLYAQEI